MTREELSKIDARVDELNAEIEHLSLLANDHGLILWSLENIKSELSKISSHLANERLQARKSELGLTVLSSLTS